ncbi:MAG: DUF3662 and FHA domain-containing protein [Actinomycetaceae bacterium]|nr:DUF3662 domain-containing protein [Arcanobacterium sp.]MDD7505110.1 DUF3662 and FHA domain-containing protein [Actinomycetaceae bacterium]
MGAFDRIERSVENAVDNVFSRAFRSDLKPIELASGIKKAMDDRSATMSRARVISPNQFVIALSPSDFSKIEQWGEDSLIAELKSVARDYASEQRYTFLGPIDIQFTQNSTLPRGKISVNATSRRGAVAPATIIDGTTSDPIIQINSDRYILTGAVTVIGRGSACDITVDDSGVSRKHLELRVTPNGVIARDLNTTNGTYVEGHKVDAATLVDGNTITIGHTTIMFWTSAEGE